MPGPWSRERILIVVRTYPVPAWKGVEVSCTAGIKDGQWLRLFPVPYRFLDEDKRFRKYQIIEADIRKASDARPESYNINSDTIQVISEPLPYENNWNARKEVVYPLRAHCMCCVRDEHKKNKAPTLSFFKPSTIKRLVIQKDSDSWTQQELDRLRQHTMFRNMTLKELEKIPYKFYYEFSCDHATCKGHRMSCTDWEMGQSYRRWTWRYRADWEVKFRERYETDMIEKNDTHFYVGTVHQHPMEWIIVGLFYPRRVAEPVDQPSVAQQMKLL